MVDHTQLAFVRQKGPGWRWLHSLAVRAATLSISVMMAGCSFAPLGKTGAARLEDTPSPPRAAAKAADADEPAARPQPKAEPAKTPTTRSVRSPQKTRSRIADRSSTQRIGGKTKLVETSARQATPGPGVEPHLREFVSAVGLIVKTLESANVAFNTPKSMASGRAQPIHLIFAVQSFGDQLRAAGDAPGDEIAEPARLSHRIEARLYGNSEFEIIPATAEKQPIGSSETARWQWQVKPLRDGVHPLYLTVSVNADVRGQTITRAETFQRQIVVEVTPWSDRVVNFASDHWQWVWASMMMPLIGWMWGKQRKPFSRPATG